MKHEEQDGEVPVPEVIPWIPRRTAAGLDEYITGLRKVYGEALLSVILHGSAVRKDFVPGVSDLNVLIVLRDESIREVKKALTITRRARKRHLIEPRFMSPESIRAASDALPLAFLDMKESRIVLQGTDVLENVRIDPHNLRLQCEYQLRFIKLRMRNLCLFSPRRGRFLESGLICSFTNFLHLLRSVLRLLGERPPEHPDEVARETSARLGLDETLIHRLLELKYEKRRARRAEMESLFEGFLDLLEKTIHFVDELPVGVGERESCHTASR